MNNFFKKRGATLIEIILSIGISSIAISACTLSMYSLSKANKENVKDAKIFKDIKILNLSIYEDIYKSHSVEINDNTLYILLNDGDTIEYQILDGKVIRNNVTLINNSNIKPEFTINILNTYDVLQLTTTYYKGLNNTTNSKEIIKKYIIPDNKR